MKKIITYLLLFSYTTSVVMPILPFAKDLIAHTFWAYEHISTVHLENGKYHTHFESLSLAKKADPEKTNDVAKAPTFAAEHIIVTNQTFDFHSPITPIKNYSQLVFYLPYTYFISDVPPPKC